MSEDKAESSNAISHLEETSVPAWVYPYRAGVIGGALGGLTMIAVAAIYGLSSGRGLWLPVNLIGATLVRDLQTASLEELSQFNFSALAAGLFLHLMLAIGLGFVFALLLPTLPGPVFVWAIVIGSGLWILASLLTLPLLNPVMGVYVDRPSFYVAHVAYCIVLGLWVMRSPKIHVR